MGPPVPTQPSQPQATGRPPSNSGLAGQMQTPNMMPQQPTPYNNGSTQVPQSMQQPPPANQYRSQQAVINVPPSTQPGASQVGAAWTLPLVCASSLILCNSLNLLLNV